MSVLSPESVGDRAAELAATGSPDAWEELQRAAGGDRALLEAARNVVAGKLHTSVDDWSSTAALSLLNRSLAGLPRNDPLDWRVRWGQRFRRP